MNKYIKYLIITIINFIILSLIYLWIISKMIWEFPSFALWFAYANYGSLYLFGVSTNDLELYILTYINIILTFIIIYFCVLKYSEKKKYLPYLITLIIWTWWIVSYLYSNGLLF